MDNLDPIIEEDNVRLSFFGDGAAFLGIIALNLILTIITLGFYYPWAKVAYRKYLWNETEFKGSRFVFNGNGKEIFRGFVIAYVILVGFWISITFAAQSTYGLWFIGLFYILLLILLPFAIFGAWKYRVSRTSWRGIHFSFDGEFKEFLGLFLGQLLLTIVTFGIYGAWMRVKIQQYLFSHTKIGDLRFNFRGDGGELFGINILGAILTPLTLYLYIPFFMKNRFNFTVNNTTLADEEQEIRLYSNLQGSTAFGVIVSNFLLTACTLGIGYPWALMRSMRMYFDHIELPEEFDYDALKQTEQDYRDATGDGFSDILDVGFDF